MMDPEYNVTDVLTKRGNLEADTHRESACKDCSDAASAKELPETTLPACDRPSPRSSAEQGPADTSVLYFQSSELQDFCCLSQCVVLRFGRASKQIHSHLSW